MSSINNLYTGWNIIFGILSSVSLGFIIKNRDVQPDETMNCNVQLVDISYTLYQLLISILIARIFFTIIHIIVFINTIHMKRSFCRNAFYTFLAIIYGLSIFFSVIMIIKFKNTNECYNFYKDNNEYFYKSFIILCGVFVFEIIWFIVSLINICCSSKREDDYNVNSYNSYNRIY